MSHKEPIFTKHTKQFTVTFPVSPMSYKQKLFVLFLSMFIVVICGGISIYRIINSPNFTISQVITSTVVSLLLLSSPIMALLHIQKIHKNE